MSAPGSLFHHVRQTLARDFVTRLRCHDEGDPLTECARCGAVDV